MRPLSKKQRDEVWAWVEPNESAVDPLALAYMCVCSAVNSITNDMAESDDQEYVHLSFKFYDQVFLLRDALGRAILAKLKREKK